MPDRPDISFSPSRHDASKPHGLRSLQFKASLLMVLLILLVSLTMMMLSLRATRAALMDNESYRTQEWAASLAAGAAEQVAEENRGALQRSANGIIGMHGVAYVAFADRSGRVLAWAESCAGLLSGLDAVDPRAAVRPMPERLSHPEFRYNRAQSLTYADVVVPVRVYRPGQLRAAGPARLVGYLRFATDITDTQARLRRIASNLGRIAIGVVLLIVPCSLLVTRRVVAPLHHLARVAHALAHGAMDVRAAVHSRDEIGELAGAFNFMADQVARARGELLDLNAQLERRVAERTHDLEEQAARDPLTGLYNRRHFGDVITREFAAAERYGPDLTCLMFDVDHFKEINDRYGHRTGDKVLITLAQAISAELRTSDVAARFGGDEFILLLPQTAAAQASVLADRIMERFAGNLAEVVPGVSATLSIGVASLHTTRARSSEALIHEADVALYAAKEGGRNRTIQAVGAA